MGISFKSSFRASDKIKQITARKKKALEQAVNSAAGQIIIRTAKGEGADGALKPYSKAYAKYKLRSKGKDLVNLSESGQMMQAVKNTVEENSNGLLGRIFFTAQEAKKAFWNQQLRPNFFKLSRAQLETIIKKLRS